ncbi:MCE family protein [Saccharopolyspora rectivirgula]|jgi:phospholipid/cholesterol/gamma-HCH transport system substrate-binding protein|uniref:MCE family protein n=1 Tax=Saccharopolyspora rectivirgula TaxID=28042 RepID=UPI0004050C9B|nr:MCE family protein [Saccharopolyspora rectivirgula]
MSTLQLTTTERPKLFRRGAVTIAVLLLTTVLVVLEGAGTFQRDPVITADIPASAGLVPQNAAVQYRGVRVGEVIEVETSPRGSRLAIRVESRHLSSIPAQARARLLPKTLFGDQYIDLAVPAGGNRGAKLSPGAHLPPDTSVQTQQLYSVYLRLYELLDSMEPAKLQTALSALAEAVHGRGDRLRQVLDQASELAETSRPALDALGQDLATISTTATELGSASPELLAALDNTMSLTESIAADRAELSRLLTSGLELTEQAEAFLDQNAQRVIKLVRATEPFSEIIADHPGSISAAKASLEAFADSGNRAFATGFFKIRASLTLDQPYPYHPEDCPRYPGLAGPNCPSGQSPALGPEGSEAEKGTLRQLAPLLPGAPSGEASPDLLSVMFAPMLRGSEVVVP